MDELIMKSFSIYFFSLEIIVLLYIFLSFLPLQNMKHWLEKFVEPILRPVRYLLKHSVFGSSRADSSPIIVVILLSYIGQLLSQL